MINKLINILLKLRTIIKIYHWNTKIYKDHIISNDLLSDIDDLTDKLTEVLLGLEEETIKNLNMNIDEIKNTDAFIKELKNFYEAISTLNIIKPEIKNIIDDINNSILKSIYLLKKK